MGINPWWKCHNCKRIFQTKFRGMEDYSCPPEEQIPEGGICVDCARQYQIKQDIARKGSYKPKLPGFF